MNESLLNRILKDRKRRTRSLALILCLSMIVSLGTFAGFHKTAVAKVYTREVLDCPYTHEGAEPVAHVHNDDCYDGDTLVCTLPELEAHTHSDACYTERQVLTCTLEENPGHQHGDACYTEREELRCGLEENPGHQHGDACYTEREVLRCGLEENPGHQHGEACYDENGVLTCQIPEGEGAHTHTAECYETVRELSCQIPEGEGAHAHTAECYETVRELTCQIPEGEGAHTHTAECYETVRELTCGKQELTPHVHGPECIRKEEITVDEPEVSTEPEATDAPEMPVSDPNADLESASDWERDFDGMELSGNWAEDLVLVAATQQGHGESQNNFEAVLNDAGDAWVRHGYTRYGAWSGAPYAEEWSAMFVSFCLRYAGIPAENVPNSPTAALMAESFQKGELFAGRDYLPAVGDLIFFDTDDEEGIDHMGIVYHVDEEDGSINAVEGSRTDAVETFGYRMDDEEIAGYGILPQNPNYTPVEENIEDVTDDLIVMTNDEEEDEEKKETEEVKPVEGTKTAEEGTVPAVPMPAQNWERTAGGIKVSVEAPEGAFPENTKIAVTPVSGDSLKDTVSDAVSGEVLEVQAVDITFFDAEGNEIEPAVPIRVVMTPAETEHAEEKTNVVHIDLDQQTAEVIEQAAGTETDNSEVVFDADAFTIYAIVYTYDVHFEYEVDGKTYTPASSMPGAKDLSLADVVRGLGIVEEQEIDTFVSKISTVASTDEAVVSVGQDGTIRVLKDGEAQIVITMQDGAQFKIDVTAEGETSAAADNAVISTVGELYLPEDAVAKAEVVDGEQAIEAVKTETGEETEYTVFDISLENVDTEKYEEGFEVQVGLDRNISGKAFRLYHVHDGQMEDITESLKLEGPVDENGVRNVTAFSFKTESFSDFVLSYTVDFFYGEYEYHMQGGDQIPLSTLFTALGIDRSVEGVKDVVFSNPSLVEVVKTENDWLLESLVPFTSWETLTVTMNDGTVVTVRVTDATYTSNLGVFLDSIDFSGVEKDQNGRYIVKQGVPYTMQMNFSEKTNGDQFAQGQPLTYTFPDGFEPLATSGDVTITGPGGPVTFHYVVSGNSLTVIFDRTSKGYESFVTSETAEFEVHIAGVISKEEINFNTSTTGNFSIDTTRGISVSKEGTYDPATNKIKYTVYATAAGNNTDVHIGDTISGTALTYDSASGLKVTSNKRDNVSYTNNTANGETFGIDIATMEHGETITLEYYADVDLTKVSDNGQGSLGTVEQTGNTVKATSKEQPDPSESTSQGDRLKNRISLSSVGKSAGEQEVNADTGKTTIPWTITLNKDANVSLAGKTITDVIDPKSQSIMRYSGDGIRVEKFNKDGTSAGDYSVSWGQNGLTNEDNGNTWSYTIPSGDTGNYKYVITYTTEVDSDTLLKTTEVKNKVSDEYGNANGGANVKPTGETVTAAKRAFSSTVDTTAKTAETEWEITFTVPKTGLNSAVVTDTLPTSNYGTDTYKNDSFYVKDGDLISDETATAVLSDDQKSLVITFKKGNAEGLYGSEKERTIHLYLTTVANHNWLVEAETQGWARVHQNNANVQVNGQDITTSASVTYNTTERVLTKEAGYQYVTNENPSLPVYGYKIILKGVSEDSFDDQGYLTIEDAYNSAYLTYNSSYSVNDGGIAVNGKVFGNGQYNPGAQSYPGPYVVDESASTEGKLVFKLKKDDLPKDSGGTYYADYTIWYFLKIKDAATFETMKDTALHSDGLAVSFDNTASNNIFGTSTVTTKYVANALTKEKVSEGANSNTGTYDIKFKIEVNPEALKIGDGDTITLSDTLTNLSFDYTSIDVSPKFDDDILNRQGSSIILTLHNKQHYTVTYTTRLIGLNNVEWKNEANLSGLIKSQSGKSSSSSGGSGSYSVYTMNVQKYAEGNMNEGLPATFELYEARIKDANGDDITPDWKKVATFTTEDSTGLYKIDQITRDGVTGSLRPYSYHDEGEVEKFDGTGDKYGWYYKLVEIEAPTGYQKDDTEYMFGISDKPSYSKPYTYLNDDTVTIINKPAPKTGVSVNKSWVNQDGSTTWPDSLAVAFTLKKQATDGTVSSLTAADLGEKWESLKDQLTKNLTENPGKLDETWSDLPELQNGAVYVVEETPVAGYNAYAMDADGNYNRGTIAANVNHVASFRNENNIIPIDEETQLRLTVQKNWQDKDGNPITENLPENVTFKLERDKSYRIPNNKPVTDVTLIIKSDEQASLESKYSFERGSTAKIEYKYTDDFGNYGNPGYTINGGFIDLTGNPNGSFTVQIPESGTTVVSFKDGWNNKQLLSASATGTALVNYDYYTEEDTAYNSNPGTITVTAADTWTSSVVLPKTETINGVKYTYAYKISELELPGWNVSYSENNNTGLSESGTVVVTNKDSRIDVSVTKQWVDQGGQAEWPEGVTVTVTLSRSDYADGSAATPEIIKDGTPLTEKERNIVLSKDQPSAAWENLAALPEGVSYVVTETAVSGGTIENNQVTIGDKVYRSSVQKNGNDYVITNSDTVDVRLVKTWDANVSDDMYWEAEFILEELEYPYTPNFDDRKAHDDAGHNGRWTPVSPEVRWSISKSSGDDVPTLHNLPRFRVKDDGKTYILMYSVSEVAYSVWDSSERTNRLYSWTKGGAYSGDIHFTPEYLEDADPFTNYTIEVLNSEKNEQESVFIDFDLRKSWVPAEEGVADKDDSYAKFVLKRVSHREFKKLNDPEVDYGQFVTVKLVDGAGREITSLEVEKNAQIKLQAGFKAGADGVGSVGFENILGSTGHIYINNTSENPTQMLVASEPFRVDTDATYQYVSGERYLADGIYGVVISDRCDGTPETEYDDQDFSMELTINKNTGYVVTYDKENKTYTTQKTNDGWTLSFVGLPQSMVDTGASQETTTIYGYYFEETESQPNYKHVTFYQADDQGNKTSVINGDRENRIYFDDHVIAENRKSHLTIKKYWESQVQAEMPNVVVDIKRISTSNACGINGVESAKTWRRVILSAENNFEYDLYNLEVNNNPNDPNNTYYAYVPVEVGITTSKPGDPGISEDGTVQPETEIEFQKLDSRVSEKVSYLAAKEGDEIDYKKIKTKYEFYEKMGNIPDDIRQSVVQNGSGTICIVNWPKKTGYQMAIRKRWHKFTTDGGMTTESDYDGAYFTAMLVQIIKDPVTHKEITRLDYGDTFDWKFTGNPKGPYGGKWSYKYNGTNITIDYRDNQWLVVIPEGDGDDGSNLPMYGYYEVTDKDTGEKTRKLVEYDYTVREISVTSTDGYHWAISDHIQEASAQDVTDSGLNENDHVWMLDNYPDADLKIIKHWPTKATNQETNKVYFKITDTSKITETNPTNNVIQRIVEEKSYAEHAITASDVEYLEDYGWCLVVRGTSNSTDDWVNYIDHLPLFDFSTTKFTDGPIAKGDMPGELNYNVEEVAVRKIDGTLVSSGKLYIPYYEVTTRGTKGSIRSSADGIQLGMYDTEKGELQPTIVEVTNNANTNLKVEKRFYEKDQSGRTVQVNPAETKWKDEDGKAISRIQYVVQVGVIKNTERTDNGKIVIDSETDTKYLVAFNEGNLTLADDKETAHKYELMISQEQDKINTDHYGVYWKDQPLALQGLPSVAISTDGTNSVVTQYSYSIEETAVLLENGQEINKFVKDADYDEEEESWKLSNTRTTIEYTDLKFTKEWQNSAKTPVAWPDGMQISVKVTRRLTKTGETQETVDPEFSYEYTIKKTRENDGTKFTITKTPENAPDLEKASDKDVFSLHNLLKTAPDGIYNYYVSETAVPGYLPPVYKNTSGEVIPTGAAGGGAAPNGGSIINTESGYELPQTGGIGTTLFTALGGLMTVAAGAVLTLKSYRRRKQNT